MERRQAFIEYGAILKEVEEWLDGGYRGSAEDMPVRPPALREPLIRPGPRRGGRGRERLLGAGLVVRLRLGFRGQPRFRERTGFRGRLDFRKRRLPRRLLRGRGGRAGPGLRE